MVLKIAYLKNHNQVLIRSFNLKEATTSQKLLNIEGMDKEEISCLLIDQSQIEDFEIKNEILEGAKFYPIRDAREFKLSFEQFESISTNEASAIFSKINQTWTLQNNISLLENMHTIVAHLNKLFPNDRTAFFEELWYITKKNIGALNLKIVYNDIKPSEKNEIKNTLIQVVIEGNRVPNPKEGGAFEKSLMDNYSDEFSQAFNIVEFVQEKGQMVIAGNFKKSPFLMMINTHEVSRISQAVVKNLFHSI